MGDLFSDQLRMPRAALGVIGVAIVLVAIIALAALVLIRLGPQWLTDETGLTPAEEDEARGRVRTALFAMLAGVIALVGAIYTARTFALSRRGQITERFTRAIDQLGNDKMEVRLGGIYALERIADESPSEHGPIFEVLTAYVRENSPCSPRHPLTPGGETPASKVEHETEEEDATRDDALPPEASVDIKAILTVLARRNLSHEHETPVRFDLTCTNLRGVEASGVNLKDANLFGAQLEGARMQRAQLHGARLYNASLLGAQLQNTDFRNAALGGANLFGAALDEANLQRAELPRANLMGASLQKADLRHGQLQEAKLKQSQLQGADLRYAQLQGADLRYAQLQGADLRYADIQRANLADAQLEGAQLGGAKLRDANLSGASWDDATTWPDDFPGGHAEGQLGAG
jgi:uncharacterized protein YjbI with pentapeptide repeats